MANSKSTTHTTGRLTKDVEIRSIKAGMEVANFSLAVNYWNGSEEATEFQDWVVWNEREIKYLGEYGRKGDHVSISGRTQTRRWEDKEGNTQRRVEYIHNKYDPIVLISKTNGQGGGSSAKKDSWDKHDF